MAYISPHPFSSAVNYQRHQPEQTILYKLVQNHLLSFYYQMEQEKELPSFVKKEFEEFLKCGLLPYGFLRLQCQSCQREKLIAFSCKGRRFCLFLNTSLFRKKALLFFLYPNLYLKKILFRSFGIQEQVSSLLMPGN